MGTITKAFTILLLSAGSLWAFDPPTRPNTLDSVTFTTDATVADSRSDVQGAVNAAIRGDKVHIPECTDPTADLKHGHRTYKWTGTVTVKGTVNAVTNPSGGKNIEIYGDGKDVTIINQANNAKRFDWTTENQQPYITAKLHHMTIWGEGPMTYFSGNAQLLVNSVGTPILNSAGMGQGGVAIGDIKWECNHALTGNLTRDHWNFSGFVTGVIYNFEVDDSGSGGFLTRPSNEYTNTIHNMDRSGTNTSGTNGEYSWTQPWTPGSFDAMYYEDGIEYHSNYGMDSDGGGGREVERYITRWSYSSGHGFRESSARALPPRILESYNIHALFNGNDPSAGTPSINACNTALGNRGGQQIYFNTYATMLNSKSTAPVNTNPIPFNYYAVANAQKPGFTPSYWDFYADGRNKWDLNQRDQENLDGSFRWPPDDGSMGGVGQTDPHTYQVDAGYTIDNSFGGQVTNGIPADTREGYVYFHGTGADSQPVNPKNGSTNQLVGVTLHGTGLPNPIPQHYLRGFTILRTDMARTSGPANGTSNYGLIVNSSVPDVNGKINIQLGSMWAAGSSVGQVKITPTTTWEIRKVRDYAANIGGGQASLRVAPSATGQATLALPAGDTGLNPRWADWTNPGSWQWKNFLRTSTAANPGVITAWAPRDGYQTQWLPDPNLNAFEYQMGAYKHLHNNVVMPGYPWDAGATVGVSNDKSLIGSHTSNSFVDSNAAYASFYPATLGAPTVTYPHPLRVAVGNSDPVINPGPAVSDTFTVGFQGTHTFTAQGNPLPTFTATGVPGFATFTDGGGNGTAILTGTPGSTAGQPFTVTVTAHGYLSHTDTQVLTLHVVSPTPNNPPNAPTLTAPASGGQYTTGASITLTATSNGDPDSGDSVASVKFYDGNTLLNTDTSAPYSFTVASATQGAHSYSAVAVDTHGAVSDNSNVAAVTVADAPVLGVQWQTPADGQTFPTSPTDIQLLATATGPNGISKIEYYNGSTFLGSVSTPPYTFSWLSVQAGTYPSLIARAYDAVNSSTVDDTISITVQTPPSTSPTPAVIQARQ